jgi:hypothetical protein
VLSNGQNETAGDCNDHDATMHASFSFYKDNDRDGYGAGPLISGVCAVGANTPPPGYSTNNTDCNDNDPTVHSLQTYYRDADGDGYGNPAVSVTVCSSVPPAGYVSNNLDCNDNDPAISPAAVEVCNNKIDDNCNGLIDEKTSCQVCKNGQNPTTTNITATSAQLNWTAIANPTQWHLQYKSTAPGSQWTDVPPLTGNIRTVKITSLLPKTNYSWRFQALCLGSWTGYASNVSFTTPANGADISSITAATLGNSLRIYPDPNKGQFVVELNLVEKINAKAEIQLIDMTGRGVQSENAVVNSGSLQKTIIASPSLAQGVYIVKILVNDKVYKTQMVLAK